MDRIQLFKPRICEAGANAAREVILSSWPGMGPKVKQFEDDLSKYIDCTGDLHVVALNSGTAALHIACQIAKENLPGRPYILSTPMTFVSTNHAIKYVGLEPIFTDIEWNTGNMEWHSFCKAIREYGDKIAAILPVHYGGQPVDLYEMKYYLKKHGQGCIPIIEDCAHAMGGEYMGNTIGRGDLCCFSFHAVKNLPIGDGGALTTYDHVWAEKAKRLRWLGIDKSTYDRAETNKGYLWYYECPEVGFKSHMDDIHAAIGIEQLKVLDEENKRREEIARLYTEGFTEMTDVWPLHQKGCRTNTWHLYVVRFATRAIRDKVQDELSICGVGTGVHYLPNYKFEPYKNCIKIDNCPQAEEFYQVALTLPMHMYLTDHDVKEVVWLIGEALNGNKKGS